MSDALSFVEANGVRFAYLSEGTGPLVLLIHGFPDTPQTWNVARPALAAAGFRAVTPFTRGYTPTAVPSDGKYDSKTLGQDVLALIEALGEKRAILVGHDWGASAVYSAASFDPSRVSKLVTVAIPHPASIRPTLGLLWKARHFISLPRPGAEAMMAKNNFAHVDELVHRWSPKWNVPADETRAVKDVFRDPASLTAALGYYRARRFKDAGALGKISVPTVSFAGQSDLLPVSTYHQAARWFTGGYSVEEMPGGHFLHREYPEEFARRLVKVVSASGG